MHWRLTDGYALNSAGNVQGNTVVSNVKAADVDGDGVSEVVTSGFTYDGEKVNAQLRVWNWTANVLNLEATKEWSDFNITEAKTVSLCDVDGDGLKEIVTSGGTVGYGAFGQTDSSEKETAQLRVWSHNGNTLTLDESQDWIVGEGVMAWNVATADLENNGVNEIVTVGCMYVGTLCDPDMRIWSMQNTVDTSEDNSLLLLVAAVAVIFVVAAIATFVLVKRQHQKTVNNGHNKSTLAS